MAAQGRSLFEYFEALQALVQNVGAGFEQYPIDFAFVENGVDDPAKRSDICAELLELAVGHVAAIARIQAVKLQPARALPVAPRNR